MNRPFDAARYADLLEGLEATEVQFAEIATGTTTKRFDPEYFNKTAMLAQRKLDGSPKLGEFVADGYRVVYESTQALDREDGIRASLPFFLQATNINTPFIDDQAMICVSTDDWARYPKGHIRRGELLIEVKGRAEKIAIVPDDFPERTLVTGTCFKLTTKEPEDRFVLTAYLTSKYGQALKNRLKTNLLVSYIAKSDLYGLPVPKLSSRLRAEIVRCFNHCFAADSKARQQNHKAEVALLNALDLINWNPPQPLSYVRSSRDAFTAGRLDPAHFAPTASLLEVKIKQTKSWALLGDLLALNLRGSQPVYADTGIPVVNSKHIVNGEVCINDDNRCGICSDDQGAVIRPGDVLINGTGVGTIGRAAPYLRDHNALPDNHVTILRTKPNAIDPVYLAVFLNSLAGQLQVSKWLHGSSGQIELYPSDIAQFVVWLAPKAIQQLIRKAIEAATINRRSAAELLGAARRAVEIAIEDSEAAALQYLASFDPAAIAAP